MAIGTIQFPADPERMICPHNIYKIYFWQTFSHFPFTPSKIGPLITGGQMSRCETPVRVWYIQREIEKRTSNIRGNVLPTIPTKYSIMHRRYDLPHRRASPPSLRKF